MLECERPCEFATLTMPDGQTRTLPATALYLQDLMRRVPNGEGFDLELLAASTGPISSNIGGLLELARAILNSPRSHDPRIPTQEAK